MNYRNLTDKQIDELVGSGTSEEKREAMKEFLRRFVERAKAEDAKLTPEQLKRKRAERFMVKLEDITFPSDKL